MAQTQPKYTRMKPFKYEMTKRREMFKAMNAKLEEPLRVPMEAQPDTVRELVSPACYNNLCPMLDLPSGMLTELTATESVSTIISFRPEEGEEVPDIQVVHATASLTSDKSESSGYSLDDTETVSVGPLITEAEAEEVDIFSTETSITSENLDARSDFVEVEKPVIYNRELDRSWKSVLRFLDGPEEEVATWRVKEIRKVSRLEEMTLEEQGDYLINKITQDFCDWVKKIGGDEKTFINEEIIKELFQIGLDNPASRAVCVKMREKRVLSDNLAGFLQILEKSFHKVLALHLDWDAEVEQEHSTLEAFGTGLPKNLQFKVPDNKTAETWLEWNKLPEDQLSFADVYGTIRDLRSTREYCKWLLTHPEYKKPQYLVDKQMFAETTADSLYLTDQAPYRMSPDIDVRSTISTYDSADEQEFKPMISRVSTKRSMQPRSSYVPKGSKVSNAKSTGTVGNIGKKSVRLIRTRSRKSIATQLSRQIEMIRSKTSNLSQSGSKSSTHPSRNLI